MLPSSKLPFLNVPTDGRKKDRHNREVLILARLLQASGVKRFCLHHVAEAGMDKTLPLMLDGRWYDISYVTPDGECFMVEVMRVNTARGPAVREDGTPWLKQNQNSPSGS